MSLEFREYYIWICRFWGFFTCVGLLGIGVETCYDGFHIGFYLFAAALLIAVLEGSFVILAILRIRFGEQHRAVRFCYLFDWFNEWKKAVIYFCLGIPCFLKPQKVWLAVLSGIMVEILCLFYAVGAFREHRLNMERLKSGGNPYNRFNSGPEDVAVVMDDPSAANSIARNGETPLEYKDNPHSIVPNSNSASSNNSNHVPSEPLYESVD